MRAPVLSRFLDVEKKTLVILHIIDDVYMTGVDVEDKAVLSVQELWRVLYFPGLPQKPTKCTPLGTLELDTLPS